MLVICILRMHITNTKKCSKFITFTQAKKKTFWLHMERTLKKPFLKLTGEILTHKKILIVLSFTQLTDWKLVTFEFFRSKTLTNFWCSNASVLGINSYTEVRLLVFLTLHRTMCRTAWTFKKDSLRMDETSLFSLAKTIKIRSKMLTLHWYGFFSST